jgi:hypothetical protein
MKKYKIRVKRILMAIVFPVVLLGSTVAQSQNCSGIIQEGEILYSKGLFTDLISSLSACRNSAELDIQFKSHRLIAMAYLGLNEPDSAKVHARKMLELNTRYQPSYLKDPSELIKLLNSIPVIPKMSFGLGLSIGTNSTVPRISDIYTLTEMTKIYTGKNSFQFGISYNYQINEKFSFDLSLMASSKKYELDYSIEEWDLKMDEELVYLNIPIGVRYQQKTKFKIKPYIQLGGYAGYLLSADNNYTALYKPTEESYAQFNISSLDRRNKIDYGFFGGIGASYKMGDGQMYVQANYFNSLRNTAIAAERYSDPQLRDAHFYIDDDIKLNNLAISIGYSLYLDYKLLKD